MDKRALIFKIVQATPYLLDSGKGAKMCLALLRLDTDTLFIISQALQKKEVTAVMPECDMDWNYVCNQAKIPDGWVCNRGVEVCPAAVPKVRKEMKIEQVNQG